MKLKLIQLVAVLIFVATILFPLKTYALTRSITFPVVGSSSYSNDYSAIHNGTKHNAIDIIAGKGQKLVAAVSGTITRVNYPQPSWGYSVSIRDSAGYRYNYLHINDDKPGTNNGKGGAMNAYAPDVCVGDPVVAGQLLGWVGDSGNSNGVSHLHFEAVNPDGDVFNPYDSLKKAKKISSPVATPKLPNELLPYGAASKINLSVAMGHFDEATDIEVLTGAGEGFKPQVKVYNGSSHTSSFLAYDSDFMGGVDVAAGDVDGDGVDEIITGASTDEGVGRRIHIHEKDGALLNGFYAFSTSDAHGVRVTAGDVDGDGTEEIIVGHGRGGPPEVRVFSLDGTMVGSFEAYKNDFEDGIDVAAGDVVGTNAAEIITTSGLGATKQVKVWQGDGTMVGSFYPYGDRHLGGVNVSVGNVITGTPKEEILTVPAHGNGPHLKLYAFSGSSINSNSYVRSGDFIESWWVGPYDVAAGYGTSRAATGDKNRRASVRIGL